MRCVDIYVLLTYFILIACRYFKYWGWSRNLLSKQLMPFISFTYELLIHFVTYGWRSMFTNNKRIIGLILLFSLALDGWWFRTKIEGTTWTKVWWSCWWNNAWRIPGSTFSVWCDMGGGFRLVDYLNWKIRRVFLFEECFLMNWVVVLSQWFYSNKGLQWRLGLKEIIENYFWFVV